MVKLGQINEGDKLAYIKLQGLDTNFGNYKKFKLSDGREVVVKKLLPSDEQGVGYILKDNKSTYKIDSFQDLIKTISDKEYGK